jgi:hypothetical protein
MALKDTFIKIFQDNIKRQGADKLLEYLTMSDFFTAPASTKFHLDREGGLVEHSLNVYYRLKELVENEKSEWSKTITQETIAIAGLLHDVCKVNFYKVDSRNTKQPDGSWKSVPYYTIDEELPYGHGEKSVYILAGFIKISRDEAMAINWHMGGFDERVKGGSFQVGKAYEKHPLAALLHVSDLLATYLDEADD